MRKQRRALTHEWFHSNRLPNTTREGLLDEENSVYYLTEYMAPDIGYPKNPDYYNKPSDPFPDYDLIGQKIGRPKPSRPSITPDTKAYSD